MRDRPQDGVEDTEALGAAWLSAIEASGAPELDPFLPIIDQILEADRALPKKQRHTAQRIFERVRDKHGFTGGVTIVTDDVREKKRRTQEVFVPLSHPPAHAQIGFGEGERCRAIGPSDNGERRERQDTVL